MVIRIFIKSSLPLNHASKISTFTRSLSSSSSIFAPASASSPSPRPGSAIYPSLPTTSIRSTRQPELQVDHLVVGAGAVGLAIAAQLASRWPEKTTYVVERHERAGEETR